jgi:hypothetical protein
MAEGEAKGGTPIPETADRRWWNFETVLSKESGDPRDMGYLIDCKQSWSFRLCASCPRSGIASITCGYRRISDGSLAPSATIRRERIEMKHGLRFLLGIMTFLVAVEVGGNGYGSYLM